MTTTAARDRDGELGVIVSDATIGGFPILWASEGFTALTGYRSSELLGRSCSLLQGAETSARSIGELSDALAAGREADVTLLNYRADGSPFWNEVTVVPERDGAGEVVRYLGVAKDVSRKVADAARIYQLAHHDALTGLANRQLLGDRLGETIRTAIRRGTEAAVVFVDLDDFKDVNDRLGHLAGDALLRKVASRLRGAIGRGDLLARPGGDEFIVLLSDGSVDATGPASELAGRLLTTLREPFSIDGSHVDVRASVGISVFPRDARTPDELLGHADAAMYTAKRSGKDSFHVFRGGPAPIVEPRALTRDEPAADAAELELILATDDVRAVFQPIVELDGGAVVGYEALARGPEGSRLRAPAALFAAADAEGRTAELDWLCRATAARAALDAGIGRDTTLFVNVEPTAITVPGRPEQEEVWARALRELDVVLEITERSIVERPHALLSPFGGAAGLALDDVGADVRSLAVLPVVEPEVVKLDLGLVQRRPSTEQAAIVSAVAAEAERTGARILAEGIETDAHLATARAIGATLGQGWRFGRPGELPASATHTALTRRRHRHAADEPGVTPFALVTATHPAHFATKAMLMTTSRHLEHRALGIGEGAVVLSSFQTRDHFTPPVRRRYETLGRGGSLVAAFGLGVEPVRGVHGVDLDPGDPLVAEWDVVVLGPHFSGALVARDLGDEDVPDMERRFAFATVYDRSCVVALARALVQRMA